MQKWATALALWLLACPYAAAQDAEFATRLEGIAALGKEINDHDQAAWHVTDALLAAKLPELGKAPLGFFTERVDERTVRAGFVEYIGDDYRVIFTGLVNGSTVESTQNLVDVRPAATREQIAKIKAQRAIAERYPQGLCGPRPNTVLLPSPGAPGEFEAYILAAEVQRGVIQIAGHERAQIDAEGRVKGEIVPYNAGCMAMPREPNTEAVVVSLRPDVEQMPTEMHVFKSLSHQIPIYVVGQTANFLVEGESISIVPASKPG